MADLIGGKIKKNDGTTVAPVNGAWYDGRRYLDGQLLTAGQDTPGNFVSAEVNAQSAKAQGVTTQNLETYLQTQSTTPTAVQPSTTANMPTTTPGVTSTTGGGASLGIANPSIDLPSIYQNLYDSSGISALEKELSDKEKAFIEVQGGINDNPFMSEATRVGRVAKAQELYDQRTASLKNDIATKKADIETKLNLQTKQFDINSQQAKANLDQLNTLINLGALDNVSGETVANLTRSTGISSDLIQSAIDARKVKDVKTDVHYSTADNGTVTASVINTATGEIIATNNLGKIGNAQTTGSSTTSNVVLNQALDALGKADVIGQKPKFAGDTVKGDNMLSKEEYDVAYNSILALVGGDRAKADELMNKAWDVGQYQRWNW